MRCDALRMGSGRSASKTRARGAARRREGAKERAEASLYAGTDDPVRPVTGSLVASRRKKKQRPSEIEDRKEQRVKRERPR